MDYRKQQQGPRAIARAFPFERVEPAPSSGQRIWEHIGGRRGLLLRVALLMIVVAAVRQHVLQGASMAALLALAVPATFVASRSAAPLGGYVAAWFGFALLRASADDAGLPDQGASVAALDRWIGGGLVPTEHLQHAFYRAGEVGAVDLFTTWIHTSYYLVPHLVAIALWLRGRTTGDSAGFDLYLRGMLAIMLTGLLLYVTVPTSPPWLYASSDDDMTVSRITRVSNAGHTRDREQVYTFFTDPNPIAAMPSLHTAFTVLIALVLWRERRWLGLLGSAYALSMGFSLIYLGEHYLVDVVLGAGLAVLMVWLVQTVCRDSAARERQGSAATRTISMYRASNRGTGIRSR